MIDAIDRFRDWDAAYIMGALDAEDRRAFEQHLATCSDCAAAVSELAGMPGLLGRLPAEEAIALVPGSLEADLPRVSQEPDMVQRLAASVARKRRRMRVRASAVLAAAAAVLIAGGVLVGATIGPDDGRAPAGQPSGRVLAMDQVGPNVMTAELTVTEKRWGTRLDWTCEYSSPGGGNNAARGYELVITDTVGDSTVIASWTAPGERSGDLAASSSVPTSDIRSIEIRSVGSTSPLVRTEL